MNDDGHDVESPFDDHCVDDDGSDRESGSLIFPTAKERSTLRTAASMLVSGPLVPFSFSLLISMGLNIFFRSQERPGTADLAQRRHLHW